MSYIKKHLLANEHIVYKTKKHPVVFLPSVVWFSLSILALCLHVSALLELFPLLAALIVLGFNTVDYLFSEYAVTNKRIIMKESFYWRKSIETMLSSISQAQAHQSTIAKLCHFGQLYIAGFGGSNNFSYVKNPQKLEKKIQEVIERP